MPDQPHKTFTQYIGSDIIVWAEDGQGNWRQESYTHNEPKPTATHHFSHWPFVDAIYNDVHHETEFGPVGPMFEPFGSH